MKLTDLAEARLDSISFFLITLLALAWIVRLLWNFLGKDFKGLPRMSYPSVSSKITVDLSLIHI